MSDKLMAAAISRLEKLQRAECFDPSDLDSRPTDAQQSVLDDLGKIQYRYVTAGNQSGKSQLAAREVSWIFSDTHPTWTRPDRWSDEPLLMLVLGRTTKQIEETLYRKISQFLEPGTYKVVRQAGVIQKLVHNDNGNTILFLSHHSDREAREKVQSFVAHYVWLDEMPGSYKLIEELHRRIQARGGYFLATFTPKSVNMDIQRLVDNSDGVHSRKYKFRMLDNPTYRPEDIDAILASLETASEGYRKTVLEGDWLVAEENVYHFDYDTMVATPQGYNPVTWRHVESVDPAMKGKFGYTVWAEEPRTGIWYCIEEDYIDGILDPLSLYKEVSRRTYRYQIVRRVCDPHEGWYLGTASAEKCNPMYIVPFDKNSRKMELIKGLQSALTHGKIRISPHCEGLIRELQECRWSENAENPRIVNASSYHLLDCAQYFVDCMPTGSLPGVSYSSMDDFIYQQNEKRMAKEKEKKEAARNAPSLSRGRIRGKRRKWKLG